MGRWKQKKSKKMSGTVNTQVRNIRHTCIGERFLGLKKDITRNDSAYKFLANEVFDEQDEARALCAEFLCGYLR